MSDLKAFERIAGARRSVKRYDPEHELSDDVLKRLFELVVLSPSSFNLQHWRFVVVRDRSRKERLQQAAFNQPQVGAASAVVVVCAKLAAHEDAERIYEEAPAEIRERMLGTISGVYAGKPDMQRDESIRSASLAAMTLMYAAKAMGLATGPMIGFDPQAVAKLVELEDGVLPVMLIVLGKEVGEMRPRMGRLALSEVVKLESYTGEGLR